MRKLQGPPVRARMRMALAGGFGRSRGFFLAVAFLASSAAVGQTLSSVSLSPASVVGGTPSTGTVTLSANAPAGGIVVSLTSGTPAVATVPSSVTVASGTASATFQVTTVVQTANQTVVITGTYAAVNKTANLTVTPLLATLGLSQTSVTGGVGATGTVTLNGAAPAGGTVVTLTSSVTTRATVPASVTVAAGTTIATFPITSLPVTTSAATVITAANAGTSNTANLTVTPTAVPYAVLLDPSTVFGTSTASATVTLNGPAPTGGALVALSSLATAATVPASVTVPAGALSAAFTINTTTVASNTTATIKGTYGGITAQSNLTVASALQSYSVTLAPSSVVHGTASTGTVTLSGIAPAGGALVALTSGSTANATVPANVTVAQNARTATFTVTTLAGGTASSVNINAVYGGATKTGALALTTSAVPLSVTFAPASVLGGNGSTGTVTLNAPAPAGGLTVTLFSTDPGHASVPSSVSVSASATSATFAVTTTSVSEPEDVAILASGAGASVSGVLSLTSATLTAFTVSPTAVVSGAGSTGTLTISSAAASGGVIVGLTSSNTAAATVPATVTVPAGSTSTTFPITTLGVASTAAVTITASRLGIASTATLTVNPAAITTLTLSASPVVGGTNPTGTVTLTGLAPPGGAVVTLVSGNTSAATVPASVTVAAQTSTANFTVTTLGVASAASFNITATYLAVPKTAPLTVNPAANSTLTLSASPVVGGTNPTGTVTLTGKAPPGGAVVTLSSGNTSAATVPASVTVAAQATTANFTVTTLGVASAASFNITATYLAVPKTAPLTVNPAAISSVSVSPTSVVGGASNPTGTVTLNGKAPPGGAVVTLSSNLTSAATVPASVTVTAQATTATFSVTTLGVASTGTVTVTATYLAVPQTATLTVNPAANSAVSVSPTSVSGGAAVTGTVTLSGKAPPGGAVVTLASDHTSSATVPASVTVAAQATSANFSVTTFPVGATVIITSTYLSVPKTATLTVVAGLTAVSVTPSTVTGGTPASGTVTIASAAPAGGSTITLTSSLTSAATVPGSVVVAQGATTAPFTVTTLAVGSVQSVTISAIQGGVTKTAPLTVNPCSLGSVAAPTFSPVDVVWTDDQEPAGTSIYNWTWDTAQKASGTRSHTDGIVAGEHHHGFQNAWADALYVGDTDKVFTYVLLDPCNPPQEVLLFFDIGGATKMAFWGADLIPWGTAGVDRISMGARPATGQWVRLEVPASTLGLGGRIIGEIAYALYDGRGWFDWTGKAPTCTPATATAPSSFPAVDTVWVEDQPPPGVTTYGTWHWDANQKASGTSSHDEPPASAEHYHGFSNAWSNVFYVEATDRLIAYVLLDPCDPPREVLLQYDGGSYFVRAFWGEDLIQWGTLGVDRFSGGPLPPAGQWARLEVPAATLGLGAQQIGEITFALYDGHAWWDHVGKSAGCSVAAAAPPSSFPATDVVWMDDALPAGAVPNGVWNWDTSQHASGTKSNTEPPATQIHDHGFDGATGPFYVAPTDSLMTYILVNPCDPPREIMIQWHGNDGWEHRAFWGEDLIAFGTPGTPGRISMGAIPATGQWIRLEVPAAVLDLGGLNVYGVDFVLYDGQVWWDRVGKTTACAVAVAAPPTAFADTVWVEDSLPAGASTVGPWVWDTNQKAGGTQSFTAPSATSIHDYAWDGAEPPMFVASGDKLVAHVLINPCDPPQEIMLEWHGTDGWEHRAFWGADLIPYGTLGTPSRQGIGAMPATGQWVRLEAPANDLGLAGLYVYGMDFVLYDGQAWWDRIGKGTATGAPSIASLTLSPTTVFGGTSSIATATLTGAAPSGGQSVAISSSNSAAASVPATVTIPAGALSATFNVTTTVQTSSTSATITGTSGTDTKTAVLTVSSTPPALTSIAVSPSSILTTGTATGTATLNIAAPTGGAVVTLTSDNTSAATVPASVTVPASSLSATFTVTGHSVASATTANIQGTYGSVNKSAPATVVPSGAALSNLTLAPTTVGGGSPSTATVTLTANAPTGGALVYLSSGNTAAATVPATVTVPAGSLSTTFQVSTVIAASGTSSVITAVYSGVTKTATLTITVTPTGSVSNLTFLPTSVTAGVSSTGTVTLGAVAPFGGMTVSLSSANPAYVSVPAAMTVAAGSTTGTFIATTFNVPSAQGVVVTASIGVSNRTATLTVNPCTFGTAAAPGSFPSGDVIWSDDAEPAGSSTYLAWTWDTAQHAAGTKSHTEPIAAGEHHHGFQFANPGLYVSPTDKLFTYVLLDPCNPPKEIVLFWDSGDGLLHAAFWGADLVNWGTLGVSRISMGAVPATGVWTRLEVTASAIGVGGTVLSGQGFTAYDGRAWFDRSGKAPNCTTSIASTPGASTAETIWVDDQVPAGTTPVLNWTWDTTQKASGTQSHVEPATVGEHHHGFEGAAPLNLVAGSGDKLMTWVLLDPCDPPTELLVQWTAGSHYYRAFWGADQIPWGTLGVDRIQVGALPATGSWVRLEVLAPDLGIQNVPIENVYFAQYGGHVWWDRSGKVTANGSAAPAAVKTVSISPASVIAGTGATGTITLDRTAPAGGTVVTLTSSAPSAAAVGANVTVPVGSATTTFPITTATVSSVTVATITAAATAGSSTATLTVNPVPALVGFRVRPNLGSMGGGIQGVVTLNALAPAGGVTVNLSSSDVTAATVPSSVLVPAGSASATVTVTPVHASATATISATYATKTISDWLVVLAPIALGQVVATPSSVVGGAQPITFQVILNDPAFPAKTVNLTSSVPTVLPVPSTVTIPMFSSSASFTVMPTSVASSTPVTITASDGASSAQVVVTVTPAATLASFAFNPKSYSRLPASATVTLTARAPAGGAVVTLSNPGSVFLAPPASVTVPANQTSLTFTLNLTSVATPTSGSLTASYGGVSQTDTIRVTATPEPLTVTFSPASVVGGASLTGTVTLNGPAQTASSVALTSSVPTAVGVPASVTVPVGAQSVSFAITTAIVTAPTTSTITATYLGVAGSSGLKVTPYAVIDSLTASTTSAVSGAVVTATVLLNGLAGAGGETVTLFSSNSSVASVPASVTVLQGGQIATFPVTVTSALSFPVSVRVGATSGGETRTFDLTVTSAPVLLSLGLSPSSTTGGGSSSLTVSLNGPAPAGGLVVGLASANTGVATIASSGTIPSGSMSATFPITTVPVAADTVVPVTVTVGSDVRVANLTVKAAKVASLILTPTAVSAGNAFSATVTLTGAAPAGGITIHLSYFSAAGIDVILPNQALDLSGAVTVPAGSIQATFPIGTQPEETVACTNNVTISADGIPTTVQVYDLIVSSVTISPSSVVGGTGATGTIVLNGAPPAGPAIVQISSSAPSIASVPASVALSTATTTFPITTTLPASDTIATITATFGYGSSYTPISRSMPLTVTASNRIASITVNPTTVVGPAASTGTVTLAAVAAAGGVVVTLSSSQTSAATVPASVTVPAGTMTASFPITTLTVASTATVSISGTYGGVPQSTPLIVTPALAPASVTVTPAVVAGGTAASGTVVLNGLAPVGGKIVNLTSTLPSAASVPATVTVPAGLATASFTVTTSSVVSDTAVTITAAIGTASVTAPITVKAPGPIVAGVSPAALLPGDATGLVLGSAFTSATTVTLEGPVYSLADSHTLLCTTCPSVTLPSTVNAANNGISFSVSSAQATGYYRVYAKSSTGVLSNPTFIRVDQPQRSQAAVPPTQHNVALQILPGQIVFGSFATGGDTSGAFVDYNDFLFVGTAGSVVTVTLDRTDTATTWEDPASLDPRLDINAPDGVVYQNLANEDREPGVDLNASVVNAVLPLTGIYYIRASTSKGSGGYKLSFSFSSVAAVPSASRVIPFAGNYVTMPLNKWFAPTAVMLDPRGYPVSGAWAQVAAVAATDNKGTAEFAYPTANLTGTDGTATVPVQLTAIGKVEFNVSFASPLLAQSAVVKEIDGASAASALEIPRYAPVAALNLGVVGATEDGLFITEQRGAFERFPIAPKAEPRIFHSGGEYAVSRRAAAPGRDRKTPSGRPGSSRSTPTPPPVALSGFSPSTSTAGAAIPLAKVPQTITSCSPAQFKIAAVNWAAVTPPFTATLTDETPSTGEPTQNGVVDSIKGIYGHRVGKTIRMKLDIVDGNGTTPPYPLLVHLAVSGPHHGTLIVDPDGNRIECTEATFLWHERDAQGNIIALNEEFEYTMGTYAPYVGAVPDTVNPSVLKPVWGTAENLWLVASTVDSAGTTSQLNKSYKVHVEPGKPHHFVSNDERHGYAEPVRGFWADGWVDRDGHVKANGDPRLGVINPIELINDSFLADQYGNVLWGYANVSVTAPDTRLVVTAKSQSDTTLSDSFGDNDASAYRLFISWNDDPQMLQGLIDATLTVNYPTDPDWGSGSVSKAEHFQFDRADTVTPIRWLTKTWSDGTPCLAINQPGAYEPDFPVTVSPGAAAPPIAADPIANPLEQIGTPSRMAFSLRARWQPDPQSCVSSVLGSSCDTGDERAWTELRDNPAFKVTLVDEFLKVATDGEFLVHVCPRCDHFPTQQDAEGHMIPRPCTKAPVKSTKGVVDSVRVNEDGYGSPNSQGYIAIELLKAPTRPGTYFIQFETLEGKLYRVQELSNSWPAYSKPGTGAFGFVTVTDGEILDASFRRATPLLVEAPTQAYVRVVDPGEVASSFSILLTTYNGNHQPVSSDIPVTVTRLGSSHSFVAPVVFTPTGYVAPQGARPLRTLTGPELLADYMVDSVDGQKAGKPAVTGDLALDVKLKIDWLDEKGEVSQPSPVTRIVRVPDPTMLTPNLYVEETAIRIIATDQHDRIVEKASGSVRLDENPNTDFPENDNGPEWQFSYKGEFKQATDLRPSRSPDSANTSIAFIKDKGMTGVLRLRSLAGPRRKVDSSDLYARNWDALLSVCEAVGKRCDSVDSKIFQSGSGQVGQWVDQETYFPRAPNGDFTHQPGQNSVRDWIEALAWDTLGDVAAKGPPIGQVGTCLSPIGGFGEMLLSQPAPGHSPGEWSDDNQVVWLYPQDFRDDSLRWDRDFCGYRGAGFKVSQFSSLLSSVVIHEARHCWQRKITLDSPTAQDSDRDRVPTAPEALDSMSVRLKDSPNVWIGGANTEMHFAGPDSEDFGFWDSQRERDAVFFEKRALEAIRPSAQVVVAAAPQFTGSLTTSSTIDLRVTSPILLDAIQIRAGMTYLYDFARCGDPQEGLKPAFARVVKLNVTPDSGLTMMPKGTNAYSCSVGKCVAVTGADGVAAVDLSAATAGTYTVTATLLDLSPDGATSSATGGTFTIIVTVTP